MSDELSREQSEKLLDNSGQLADLIRQATSGRITRRQMLKQSATILGIGAAATATAGTGMLASSEPAEAAMDHPLEGQSIDMSILGIGGWLPSRLGVEMSPMFAKYAKDNYGYDVSFSFQEAPFSALFQKAAASLATRKQDYNIIISDSQWLGALSEPGWIVQLNDVIAEHPELDIEWYDPIVPTTYMEYPTNSGKYWGLPETGDNQGLFVRTDYLEDPDEREAFRNEYGYDLPQTWDDWEQTTMSEFYEICEHFTRPEDELWGTALEHTKEYDFATCYYYPWLHSTGGEIWDPETRRVHGILNTESNAEALRWNKEMLQYEPPGAVEYGIPQQVDAFTQGKTVTCISWTALGRAMFTDELQDKLKVVPPPAFEQDDGSLVRQYTMGGQPWVLNRFNDNAHMRVAIDFLKWWYKPDVQLEYTKRGGMPTDKATLTRDGIEDLHPWLRAYKYMLTAERSVDFWHDPNYSEMLAAQQEAFSAYFTGQVDDPKRALDYAACQQQKILYEAGRTEIAPPDSCANVSL